MNRILQRIAYLRKDDISLDKFGINQLIKELGIERSDFDKALHLALQQYFDILKDTNAAKKIIARLIDKKIPKTDDILEKIAELSQEDLAKYVQNYVLKDLKWTDVITSFDTHGPDDIVRFLMQNLRRQDGYRYSVSNLSSTNFGKDIIELINKSPSMKKEFIKFVEYMLKGSEEWYNPWYIPELYDKAIKTKELTEEKYSEFKEQRKQMLERDEHIIDYSRDKNGEVIFIDKDGKEEITEESEKQTNTNSKPLDDNTSSNKQNIIPDTNKKSNTEESEKSTNPDAATPTKTDKESNSEKLVQIQNLDSNNDRLGNTHKINNIFDPNGCDAFLYIKGDNMQAEIYEGNSLTDVESKWKEKHKGEQLQNVQYIRGYKVNSKVAIVTDYNNNIAMGISTAALLKLKLKGINKVYSYYASKYSDKPKATIWRLAKKVG